MAVPPLCGIAADAVHRLRLEPDMTHDRHAAFVQESDGRRHGRPALDLDRLRARLRDHPRGIAESLRGAFLIAAEGHIERHQRLSGATHHRLPMGNHHVHSDAVSRRHAIERHAHGITHQQDVAMRIQQPRHGGRIGRQADQRLAALARPDVGNRPPLFGARRLAAFAGCAHKPPAPTPIA